MSHTFTEQLYRSFANIGAALASEHRLRVLNILVQREMSVDEVAEHLGQSKANTSIHLKVLHQAHLVTRRKDGKQVFYGIAGEPVLRLWMALRDTGLAELPEVRELMHQFAEEPETLSILENREILRKVAADDVVLLDLRPRQEFDAGHLPHARSLPAAELERRLHELPKNKTIVAYCRGPFCGTAIESAQKLRAHGLDVLRMREGVLEWRAAKKRLEVSLPAPARKHAH